MKDFYINHYENCSFCETIHNNELIPKKRREELIDEHTLDAYADFVDLTHSRLENT